MTVKFLTGDALAVLRTLPSGSVQACISSPPYFALRSYIAADHADKPLEMGSEPTIDAYVSALVEVMREVRRVLHDSGVCLINLGDTMSAGKTGRTDQESFPRPRGGHRENSGPQSGSQRTTAGFSPKNLLMIPSRVALALQADGWVLRSMMPWVKRSAMPESVTDRPASAVEYVFLLAKRSRYFWDGSAIMRTAEYGRSTETASWHVKADANSAGIRFRNTTTPGNGGTRNFRNSDLFYDSLDAPPYGLISDHAGEPLAMDVNPEAFPQSHFATYPTRLVDPLIRAATSERGCCPTCGGPWVRVTERGDAVPLTRADAGRKATWTIGDSERDPATRTDTPLPRHYRPVISEAWRQSCACPAAPPVPQTVIDPFSGAGTTAMVASRLGRDAIGVELNPAYVAMARARLEADAGMFADVAAAAVAPLPVPDAAQCELFATLEAAQ